MTAQEDCASCADERAAGAAFCENCGKALATGAGLAIGKDCPSCGAAGVVGDDGYCGNCGLLAARPRDHVEADAGLIAAAVTDRGLRHHRNEDAMWLATRGADIDIVVCDGVSSSFDPDVASETAAEAAGKGLSAATGELPESVAEALITAGAQVAELAGTGDPRRAASNPACTIVAACVRGTEIGYGWVGDSRAYWIPAEGDAEQLTEDDSWATHAISLGAEPQAAWNDPKAHAITAWLGADAGKIHPRTGSFFAETPGHLVLCSDGLWNYLTEPAAFADTVRAALRDTDSLLAAARSLIDFANAAGGSDNITVVLVPLNTLDS
ncbi:PP2C family serine/threonine-protein phosphatase [Actinoplanes friuliensis]|uniref:Protein kinase and PP2C-like domain-containing protein n=1 Tax=Actinoplanes friuliensis DSM 7358 TaxID=1246995 RepID=U5W685_9ACTN|nr:PP2C family serine/threonine-protein phosphatase [Actinoplanes friuliensis]AGZ43510.1 Protein kinase and PP2C-like domain-containing protein [Actinoplanes friuliensis DSM 7358]